MILVSYKIGRASICSFYVDADISEKENVYQAILCEQLYNGHSFLVIKKEK